MAQIYEVTTIVGKTQKYEVIRVTPTQLADGSKGLSFRTLEMDPESRLESFASNVHHIFSLTGLEESIRKYPPRIVGTRQNYEIEKPERLRLIYDVFPSSVAIPILRVCPVESERIYLWEFDLNNAKLPLVNMSFSPEFEGDIDLTFAGLKVLLKLRNFERENEEYYGRDLRKGSKTSL